jgi:hypothetical protein
MNFNPESRRTQKKVWFSPQIIILQRRNPQECVLSICKNDGGITGPNEQFNGCYYEEECESGCSDIAPS